MQVEALPSSKLGTQEYWDSIYNREITNFDDLGDEGEIWFGEEAVQRMVDFVEEAREEDIFPKNPSIIDIGTGNGHLLFELLELSPPFTDARNMLGVDYSKPSIDLCKRIGASRGEIFSQVSFEVIDFLREANRLQATRWDLVCDKGTLDAIALSSSTAEGEDPVQKYVFSLQQICQSGSIFLITSCNFTEEELIRIFSQGFSVQQVVPTPSFSFGGQKGSTTTTIAFRRQD